MYDIPRNIIGNQEKVGKNSQGNNLSEALYKELSVQDDLEGVEAREIEERESLEQKKEKWKMMRKNGKKYMYQDWNRDVFENDVEEGDSFILGCQLLFDKKIISILDKITFKEGVSLDLMLTRMGVAGVKALSKMELEEGVAIRLKGNQIGPDGAKAIAENMRLKEGVAFVLDDCGLGERGAEYLSKMELERGVALSLGSNQIGWYGAKIIAQNMKLKEGVILGLSCNRIGDRGAKAIAEENMRLKEKVYLDLTLNQIGDEGAKALAENLELKEGVTLDLSGNLIGDEGASSIIENMKLKKGVTLNISNNSISQGIKNKLLEWGESYKDCKVIV